MTCRIKTAAESEWCRAQSRQDGVWKRGTVSTIRSIDLVLNLEHQWAFDAIMDLTHPSQCAEVLRSARRVLWLYSGMRPLPSCDQARLLHFRNKGLEIALHQAIKATQCSYVDFMICIRRVLTLETSLQRRRLFLSYGSPAIARRTESKMRKNEERGCTFTRF
jgi:hypothetical protein